MLWSGCTSTFIPFFSVFVSTGNVCASPAGTVAVKDKKKQTAMTLFSLISPLLTPENPLEGTRLAVEKFR
jgi:hypothetical protein